ncbi:maleylpyruvate isomerase family mycothiol-dependent enzyme [Actinomadura fibrosa]|uniref:Maleylpyruvate isomerase family mycothiol-dependent enzyme n=1 Tax=Actinomadura fibrosa TaxID=111802 RepID=A0ABW2Y2G0_9ACTN|nr:maleylpyruvate isomerase family mycothiol-dependent enzyme [Actinomadura fibrosa]
MSEDRHPAASGALAAWALDACPSDEATVIGEHLSACGPCSREAGRLRDTAGLLAAAVAVRPPPRLRESVLAAARRSRPGTSAGSALDAGAAATATAGMVAGAVAGAVPAEDLAGAYAEQVAGMDRLLGTLTAAHWRTPVPRYASVLDLVAHLTGNDAAFAADLGLPAGRAGGAREAWYAQAGAVVRGVSADARLLDRRASLAGAERVPASGRVALVQRAFETWTHADDIRAALGRPAEPPPGEHLRFVVELGTGLLPRALRALGRHHPGRTARLLLTGPGAGEWLVPLAPGEGPGLPDVTVIASAEDFCRLLADRIAPARFPHRTEGDRALADDLLRAAATLGCD